MRALRHARCEGHRHYYDVLPTSACSGKERVASGTVPLSVGSKYRNLRIAQESLAASLTWCVRGRFDAEARSPPTHTTDSQLTRCYVSRPSNIKPTMPPTCTKTSRQQNRSNKAKPTPPTVKEKSPPGEGESPCMPTYWQARCQASPEANQTVPLIYTNVGMPAWHGVHPSFTKSER